MSWWQILFFPFAIIYDIVTRIRNLLFDSGVFKVYSFDQFKIISVGNLSVGGTGKTPMVEYLIGWSLRNGKKPAVLSRGYGRKTKGLVVANANSTASVIGDESMGYFQKYGEEVMVIVCEKRARALEYLALNQQDIDLVILDDAYQHLSVHRNFNILLTTNQRPFWADFVLPSGRLREGRSGWKRADFMIVTKSSSQLENIPAGINVPFAYSAVAYSEPVVISGKFDHHVVGVSGLADNQPFFDYLAERYDKIRQFSFADHHDYNQGDVSKLIKATEEHFLICTQKDAVKLQEWPEMNKINWGYLPMEVSFLNGEQDFLKKLEQAIA